MIKVFTFSEAGGHPVNEDAFEIQCHPTDDQCWICILADGQGGRAGGGRAARLACRIAMEAATGYPPNTLRGVGCWLKISGAADAGVCADPEAGFTTMVGLCLSDGYVYGTSSGDSAVFALSDQHAEELTRHQEKNPPVGSGAAQFVPFAWKLVSPWKVLAMSDGVWKYVGRDRVREITKLFRGQALVDELQGQARLKKTGQFQDDFTLVLIEEENRDRKT